MVRIHARRVITAMTDHMTEKNCSNELLISEAMGGYSLAVANSKRAVALLVSVACPHPAPVRLLTHIFKEPLERCRVICWGLRNAWWMLMEHLTLIIAVFVSIRCAATGMAMENGGAVQASKWYRLASHFRNFSFLWWSGLSEYFWYFDSPMYFNTRSI